MLLKVHRDLFGGYLCFFTPGTGIERERPALQNIIFFNFSIAFLDPEQAQFNPDSKHRGKYGTGGTGTYVAVFWIPDIYGTDPDL